MFQYPKTIENEAQLDEILSMPDQQLIDFMKRLDGDIAILGIGGKMGPTLGRLAVNAIKAAGVNKNVYGVSRFSNAAARQQLEDWGVKTISCDLMDREAVAKLPVDGLKPTHRYRARKMNRWSRRGMASSSTRFKKRKVSGKNTRRLALRKRSQ